ncbi:type 1 glutamine amidotransferase domain-containing protein [Mesorhizobium sp. VNQ89]|uniref:type 1 glutamine amidotransferase domain-containing protein n=1 Tax=Mesorhizobium quangtriensis TaxID=3157709 RepID=UPI0032B75142
MSKGKVLIIGSNAMRIEVQGGGWVPTGQYLNETVVPAMAVIAAGYEVVLATPTGDKPHIDEASDVADHFGGDEAALQRARDFFANNPSMNRVQTLRSVVDSGLDEYTGVFVPGGHAPVVDLIDNAETGEILRHFHECGKPTALLCHGPVAVLAALPHAPEFKAAMVAGDTTKAAELAKGWQYAGYDMTIFSEAEERIAEEHMLKGKLHFYMPDALKAAGGRVTTGAVNFAANVVEDRELITGQNPSSDNPLAEKFVAALDRSLVRSRTAA